MMATTPDASAGVPEFLYDAPTERAGECCACGHIYALDAHDGVRCPECGSNQGSYVHEVCTTCGALDALTNQVGLYGAMVSYRCEKCGDTGVHVRGNDHVYPDYFAPKGRYGCVGTQPLSALPEKHPKHPSNGGDSSA